jgi:metastasis-associated protein MTA
MNQNIYRVGDWVYCEVGPNLPYVIRKIEELFKGPHGGPVTARVVCAYRRSDISTSLLSTFDRHQNTIFSDDEDTQSQNATDSFVDHESTNQLVELNEQQKYQLKHREIFYSKYTEQIQVSTIRGKCIVNKYSSDLDTYLNYLINEDLFYYQYTYEPTQKKIEYADRENIRVGAKYQAEIPQFMGAKISNKADFDELIWSSDKCKLTDNEINKYLAITQAIGTYARALDHDDTNRLYKPNTTLTAFNASRDLTQYYSFKILHETNYNLDKALLSFIPETGPVLCRDEFEDWSEANAALFELALERVGKDFNEIKREYLNWKSLESIIEYYYMWKTTNNYMQRKIQKETQEGKKLNQIYIPQYQKHSQINTFKNEISTFRSCDSCSCELQAGQCFIANMTTDNNNQNNNLNKQQVLTYQQNLQSQIQTQQQLIQQQNLFQKARLCSDCWSYWRRYASFKYGSKEQNGNLLERRSRNGTDRDPIRITLHKCPLDECGKEFEKRSQLAKHSMIAHALSIRSGSPRAAFKVTNNFYLKSTPMTRAARLKCLNIKHFAKHPFEKIDFVRLKNEWFNSKHDIKAILDVRKKTTKKRRKNMNETFKLKSENLPFYKQTSIMPRYEPDNILFEKPSDEFMIKFFANIFSQKSKKRTATVAAEYDYTTDDSLNTPHKRTLLRDPVKLDLNNNAV